jgi:radical SAM protein with 4Fe4S-binding SPASM domain
MEMCSIDTLNEYSINQINKVAVDNRLLTIEIEPSMKCNYNCRYCYASHACSNEAKLSFKEITEIITQAKELGAEKVILLGGEPTIYSDFLKVIDFINSEGLQTEIFSNGSMITAELAKVLFKKSVRIVLKLNSLKSEVMALLTGRTDSLNNTLNAIKYLKEAGYPDKTHLLGVSTVICKQNLTEIIDLWKWLKDQAITPYFEMITPQGKAKEDAELVVESKDLETLFNKIAKIDLELYGNKWDIQPPLVANKCLRNLYSCLIDSHGNVKPCVGVNIMCGNIREKKLKEIIKSSGVIQDLRNYKKKLRGPCSKCEKLEECYGCRGAAYQLTGEPLASDPLCWRNQDKLDQIYKLPFPADRIIPQTGKTKMLDSLVKLGDKTAEAELTIKPDNPYVDENGILSESVYIELLAQTIAAVNGFYALENNQEPGIGFIIGLKNIKNYGIVRRGDKLNIIIERTIDLGDFGVVSGEVYCNEAIIAEGELKIWGKSY